MICQDSVLTRLENFLFERNGDPLTSNKGYPKFVLFLIGILFAFLTISYLVYPLRCGGINYLPVVMYVIDINLGLMFGFFISVFISRRSIYFRFVWIYVLLMYLVHNLIQLFWTDKTLSFQCSTISAFSAGVCNLGMGYIFYVLYRTKKLYNYNLWFGYILGAFIICIWYLISSYLVSRYNMLIFYCVCNSVVFIISVFLMISKTPLKFRYELNYLDVFLNFKFWLFSSNNLVSLLFIHTNSLMTNILFPSLVVWIRPVADIQYPMDSDAYKIKYNGDNDCYLAWVFVIFFLGRILGVYFWFKQFMIKFFRFFIIFRVILVMSYCIQIHWIGYFAWVDLSSLGMLILIFIFGLTHTICVESEILRLVSSDIKMGYFIMFTQYLNAIFGVLITMTIVSLSL